MNINLLALPVVFVQLLCFAHAFCVLLVLVVCFMFRSYVSVVRTSCSMHVFDCTNDIVQSRNQCQCRCLQVCRCPCYHHQPQALSQSLKPRALDHAKPTDNQPTYLQRCDHTCGSFHMSPAPHCAPLLPLHHVAQCPPKHH